MEMISTDDKEAQRKERRRIYMMEWRARNAEHKKAYARKYYAENRDARIEYTRAWTERNKEYVTARKRAYRSLEETKIKEKETYKKWRAANLDKDKAKTRLYRETNRERILVRNQNRRASMKGKLSKNIIDSLMTKQRARCACCKIDLLKSGRHIDHIMPLAKGGPNIDENVQLLCPDCNLSKAALDPVDFMQRRGFLL